MVGPIEFTARYAQGGLPDLTAAWAFVMEHVDKVGDAPMIEITPFWSAPADDIGMRPDEPWVLQYSAVVSGMVEQPGVAAPEAGAR